jgi:hypothetical protein
MRIVLLHILQEAVPSAVFGIHYRLLISVGSNLNYRSGSKTLAGEGTLAPSLPLHPIPSNQRRRKCQGVPGLICQGSSRLFRAVGKNVVVKASSFNRTQQLSTNGSQQVQYQTVTNNKFQQVSIKF